MTVRPLNKSDIPFLISARETFPDAWNENMLLSAFGAGNFYGFLAEDGEKAGFLTYSVNGDTADLQDIFVVPEKRRRKTGASLLDAFVSAAREKGLKKLFLEVRESNMPAVNLYKAAGFGFLSVRKKYYADGENAWVFVKEL